MKDDESRLRNRLLEIMQDSKRLDRYYTRLSNKNLKKHRVLLIVLLASGFLLPIVLALVPLIVPELWQDTVSEASQLIFGATVAIVSIMMLVFENAQKGSIYKLIGEQCRDIDKECVQLWYESPLHKGAYVVVGQFENRVVSITKIEVENDEELNQDSHREAEESVKELQAKTGYLRTEAASANSSV